MAAAEALAIASLRLAAQRTAKYHAANKPTPSAKQGMTQAARFNPRAGGEESTFMPCSATKPATMASSSLPSPICVSIECRIGMADGQFWWLHTRSTMLHPH